MFDIGFTEILVIAVVGLLVIGPEQLPGTVRTIMLWVGRLRRSFTQARQELEKEIGAEDIRRQLHNESVMQALEQTREEVNSIAQQTKSETEQAINDTEEAVKGQLNDDPAPKPEQ